MASSGTKRGKKRQVTIADIAHHLGLSKATVSLALNKSSLVAETTRLRVVEAAEQFGYRPNYFGSRLSKGKSDMIGLYILGGKEEQCNWAVPSSWNFYNPILKAVSQELSQHGYRFNLEVVSVEQATKGEVISSVIQEGSLDGMLLVVQDDINYDFLQFVAERQYPFVVLNDNVAPNLASVKINNELGAKKAVQHLMQHGHRRIAYLGGPKPDSNAIERRKGFIKAMSDAGLPLSPDMFSYGDWQRASGWQGAQEFLELDILPTAIFCANDDMAVGAIQLLQEKGLSIPDDVSIVGFDDNEMCQVVLPNLTTIRQPLELMGKLGAVEVLRQLDEELSSQRHINLEPELIVRDSVARIRPESKIV